MTLVLSFACFGIAVQVADRLVCESQGRILKALDPIANKLVIYRARDAIVSIGYAGQAFVREMPTDEWLAEYLSGVPTKRAPGEFGGVGIVSRTNDWDIGKAMRRVRDELPKHINRGQIIQLNAVGYQISRNGLVRPLLYDAEFGHQKVVKFSQTPRIWGRSRGAIASIGIDVGYDELDRVMRHIRDANPALTHDEIAEHLTGAIRRQPHPGVGPHASAVIIPFPGSAPVRTKFLPLHPHTMVLRTRVSTHTMEAAYAPWAIGPSIVKPPTIEVGGMSYFLGGFEVKVDAPPATVGGVLGGMTTVPRFELPAHLRR